jgi:hypothetical protein
MSKSAVVKIIQSVIAKESAHKWNELHVGHIKLNGVKKTLSDNVRTRTRQEGEEQVRRMVNTAGRASHIAFLTTTLIARRGCISVGGKLSSESALDGHFFSVFHGVR